MQSKDLSEQGAALRTYVGIDLCESWLDGHILAVVSFRIASIIHGHRQVKRRLKTWNVQLTVIKATGKGYRALRPRPR